MATLSTLSTWKDCKTCWARTTFCHIFPHKDNEENSQAKLRILQVTHNIPQISFKWIYSNFCDFMQCVDVPPNHIYEPRNDKPNLTFLKKAAWMCLRIQFPAADDSFISTLMAAGCRKSLRLHAVVTASHHTFQTLAKMEQKDCKSKGTTGLCVLLTTPCNYLTM